MSETSILSLILTVIGVVIGTLGGTWLGRLLERNNEALKWRRDRCLEVYSEILTLCSVITFEADDAYGIACGTAELNEKQKLLLNKVADLYSISNKAYLIGSGVVDRKLRDLASFCGNKIAVNATKCPKLSEGDWNTLRLIDYPILFADFQTAARNDLEIFPKLYPSKSNEEYKKEFLKEEKFKHSKTPSQEGFIDKPIE